MSGLWTPGTWERRESQIGVVRMRKTGTGVEQRRFDVLAFTCGVTHRRDYRGGEAIQAEQNANGDLVAAAPDLAAALLRYVEQEETAAPYSSSPMREAARAALAKAGVR